MSGGYFHSNCTIITKSICIPALVPKRWTPTPIQPGRSMISFHTVAIWTFTFHKKSGFVKAILKANFKPTCRPVSWTFWPENSDVLHSFSFYFLQVLSNLLQLLLFQKDWIAWHFCNLNMSSHWNSSNSMQKALDLTTPSKNWRKMTIINRFGN